MVKDIHHDDVGEVDSLLIIGYVHYFGLWVHAAMLVDAIRTSHFGARQML